MNYVAPVLFVVLLWWFSTGAVLWLAGGSRDKIPARLLLVTMVSAFGFAGAAVSANSSASWSPYMGFVSAIAVWSWAEFTFLTGLLTGPRLAPCPPNVSEWKRFRLAFLTISRHEYTLVLALAAMIFITYTGSNYTALCTFIVLWLMRISAKLTVFTGAPNLSIEMMPERLNHMQSYFRADRIGPVFWISTFISTVILVASVAAFISGRYDPNNAVMMVILTTLVGLAALEHWMMVLPVKDSALWRWAMNKKSIRPDKGKLSKAQKLRA